MEQESSLLHITEKTQLGNLITAKWSIGHANTRKDSDGGEYITPKIENSPDEQCLVAKVDMRLVRVTEDEERRSKLSSTTPTL